MNRARYSKEDFFVYKKLLKVGEKKLRAQLRGRYFTLVDGVFSPKFGGATRASRRKGTKAVIIPSENTVTAPR